MIESINQRLAKLTPRNNFKSGGMGLDFPIHKSYTPLHGAAAVGGWVEIGRTTNGSELDDIDFQECNMSIGTTLAFFTNHDFDEGIKSCELIDNNDAQKFCSDGLELEIKDSDKYEINPLTLEIREKYQPQFIEGTAKIIDILSPAIISDFGNRYAEGWPGERVYAGCVVIAPPFPSQRPRPATPAHAW